jgi:hypothetical protein
MKNRLIQIRIKESQEGKLHEIQQHLKIKDNSEVIRACIDISYCFLFEKERYLIDFYDIKRSLLYKWIKEGENNVKS